MLDQTLLWPPRVGDPVSIKGSRLIGLVTDITGEGEARRFILSVGAPADVDAGSTYELTQAAQVVRTAYVLSELGPRPDLARHE
jgi:hypothetical protein